MLSFVIRIITASSFNRYMVECESFEYYINSFCFTVLIDTWWNVNEKLVTFVSPSPAF